MPARVDDAALERLRTDGFAILPRHFDAATTARARRAFHEEVAPTYEEWAAAGRPEQTEHTGWTEWPPGSGEKRVRGFPWLSPDLNRLCLEPTLLEAAERLAGVRDLRLCGAGGSIKYAGHEELYGAYGAEDHFHPDQGNQTLGPGRYPASDADAERFPAVEYSTGGWSHHGLAENWQQVAVWVFLNDVAPGMAPLQFWRNGSTDIEDAGVPAIVPAGTVALFSMFTRHAASHWDTALAPTGQRAVVSFSVARADQLWHGSHPGSSIMQSQQYDGHVEASARFSSLIVACTPRQLRFALGFPMPGDELWSSEFLDAMEKRHPGFNREPYDVARGVELGDEGLDLASAAALRAEIRRIRQSASL